MHIYEPVILVYDNKPGYSVQILIKKSLDEGAYTLFSEDFFIAHIWKILRVYAAKLPMNFM